MKQGVPPVSKFSRPEASADPLDNPADMSGIEQHYDKNKNAEKTAFLRELLLFLRELQVYSFCRQLQPRHIIQVGGLNVRITLAGNGKLPAVGHQNPCAAEPPDIFHVHKVCPVREYKTGVFPQLFI